MTDIQKRELLPCPHCGGEAVEGDHGNYQEAFVHCQSCDSYMQGNKYNVVEKWNKRELTAREAKRYTEEFEEELGVVIAEAYVMIPKGSCWEDATDTLTEAAIKFIKGN